MQALKTLWHKWEKVTARVDNPMGRTVVTATFLVLLWLWQFQAGYHHAWKFLLPAYMLTLGKFVFNVLSRVILTVIYVLLIMPVGFFVRMGDPLHIRQKTGNTFWISRETPDESLEGARRQG